MMNTPPVLRPFDTLLASLRAAQANPGQLVADRVSIVGGRDASLSALDAVLSGRRSIPVPGIGNALGTPAIGASADRYDATPERLRTLIYGIERTLEVSNLLIWRGDLFDAAAQDWELFEGTAPTPDMLPQQPELWLFDGDGPPSETKKRLEDFCAREFELPAGRLNLRGIAVADMLGLVTQLMQRLKVDSLEKMTAKLREINGETAQEFIAELEASSQHKAILGVTLLLRDRTERGDDSKLVPYIVDAQIGIGREVLHPIALLCLACIDFTKQPFTEKSENPFPRWRRGGAKPPLSPSTGQALAVNRLVLRRAERQQAEADDAGDKAKRSYDFQWIVRAHRRRLHEPRKADGKQVVWVSGHVKGNPDAPLKSSVNVAHVKR